MGTDKQMEPIEDEEAIMDAANEAEGVNNEAEGDADEELEKLKKKWQEMEEEASKLKEISEAEAEDGNAEQAEIDARSLYVGQCDYNATPEELQAHFQSSGTINRVTIICDKWTGNSKGFAYIEFASKDAVENALLLNESEFHGRALKVSAKRTNEAGKGSKGKGKGKGKSKGKGKGNGRSTY